MAKFLVLWRFSPMAQWPTDPDELIKLTDMMYAQLDALMQKGEITEFGFFPNGTSGYEIDEGDVTDEMRISLLSYPFVEVEVHEIVPYEQGKAISKAVLKAQAEAMKR